MDKEIDVIIQKWCQEGLDTSTLKNIPKHPEYIYRLSDEWQGWNVFLNLSPQHPKYIDNKKRDRLENIAYYVIKKEIDAIIKVWNEQGSEIKNGVPKYPEYVYRISREWPGWVVALNLTENNPSYYEHKRIDCLENMAFSLMCHLYSERNRKEG